MSNILIVDDEPLSNFTIVEMVETAGHRAFGVENAEAGLEIMQKQCIDAVITDIVMPVLDGYTFIKKLREISLTLPIVAVSGGGFSYPEEYLTIAEEAGATHILQKPFSFSALQEVFQDIFEDTPPRRFPFQNKLKRMS
ncbi:response regulator [Magnetovibrio sp. PR-2]|uniref:response regulator n=1 Tax=Magnetovibrio sp. PR-2 TaxID=3120356 RepID=UPI002FCE5222